MYWVDKDVHASSCRAAGHWSGATSVDSRWWITNKSDFRGTFCYHCLPNYDWIFIYYTLLRIRHSCELKAPVGWTNFESMSLISIPNFVCHFAYDAAGLHIGIVHMQHVCMLALSSYSNYAYICIYSCRKDLVGSNIIGYFTRLVKDLNSYIIVTILLIISLQPKWHCIAWRYGVFCQSKWNNEAESYLWVSRINHEDEKRASIGRKIFYGWTSILFGCCFKLIRRTAREYKTCERPE